MSSRWKIATSVIGKKIRGKEDGKTLWQKWTEEERKRIDDDIPFDIRIMSHIEIDVTDLLLNPKDFNVKLGNIDGTTVKGVVHQIGIIKYDKGLRVYKIYIKQDNISDDDNFLILSIATNQGKVVECKLFTLFDEVAIENEEDVALWIGSKYEDGLLRRQYIKLQPPYMSEYDRIQNPEKEFVDFEEVTEVVCQDPFGDETVRVSHKMQEFSRFINKTEAEKNGIGEFLIGSLVETDDSAGVEILLGFMISEASIKSFGW